MGEHTPLGASETPMALDLVSAAPTPLGAAAPTPLGAPMGDAPTPERPGRIEVLPPVARSSWTPGAALLTIIALTIGALALGINAQTGWRFGTTSLAAITFASLSIAADVLAIVLPATAAALWARRRHLLAAAAWTTWTLVVAVAVLASSASLSCISATRPPVALPLSQRRRRPPISAPPASPLTDARKELRALLKSGDDGTHIPPDKITVAQWVAQWIDIGAPGRKMKRVGRRTLERYDELLRCHVVPALGTRPLQQVQATEVDKLYQQLDGKVSPRTAHHVHVVLGACLATAVRKGLIATSPLARAEKVPSPGESDHGMALEEAELRTLIEGFKGSPLYSIVCAASFTGIRRNEILALRWTDLNVTEKTLRIERAVEQVKKQPLALKGPKTERGKRTITIDDGLIAVLVAERERHLRIVAGVPDAVEVDLSLVEQSLPDEALMFPSPEGFSFTKLRDPRAVSRVFKQRARKLGFGKLRFHDLRGTHETLLLDAGVPLKTVADRCGHDPAVLLRNYAKRSKKGDTMAAQAIAALTKGVLGNAS